MRSHPAPPPAALDRRAFLGRVAAASAAFAISPPATVFGADPLPPSVEPGLTMPPPADERGVADLAAALALGETTARALVEGCLARVEALDARGPTLRAVIERNPDALAIADRLDQERKDGKVRGPLHGIPILIKDNIDSADRMRTSAGSLALANSTPSRDAFIVERLRAAGAVLLGKTNLSEWANFRSTRSTSGWSGRGGLTRNPHVLDRSACGSSSGTGAAVAAGYVPLGIGTETDGSIICPSSICGIVGIKPTLGLWSRSGIIPISASQDTAGPMTRSVADAAVLLGPLAGPDPRDAATQASPGTAEDYSRFLDRGGLKGARIGVARNLASGFHPDIDRAFGEALAALKDAGAVLVDPANLETLGKFDEAEYEVLLYEFKAGMAAYLEALGPAAPAKTLDDLFAFNEKERAREMPFFGQEIFEQAKGKGPLTDKAYRAARAKCVKLTRKEGIDATLAKHKLDAIVAPSNGPSWPIDLVNGDRYTGGNSSFAAVAGYPSITVPMGFVHELPLGLSFLGAAWTEGKLIRLAYAFEQATKIRRAPRFLATTPSPA